MRCITCAAYHYAYYVNANISTVLRRLQANLKALREAQKVAVDAKRKALELIQGESSSWAFFVKMGVFIHRIYPGPSGEGLGWDPLLKIP